MAAARSASSKKSPKNGRNASRLSFAKITDTLTVPDLLALQTESFDWLVGNDAWKARVTEAKAAGNDSVPETTGLDEIFEEISPIEDLGETMQLSFTKNPQALHSWRFPPLSLVISSEPWHPRILTIIPAGPASSSAWPEQSARGRSPLWDTA